MIEAALLLAGAGGDMLIFSLKKGFVFKVMGSVLPEMRRCVLYCSNRPSTWQHGSTCQLMYFTVCCFPTNTAYVHARVSKITRLSTDDAPQTRHLFSSSVRKVFNVISFSDLDDVDGRN